MHVIAQTESVHDILTVHSHSCGETSGFYFQQNVFFYIIIVPGSSAQSILKI